MDLPPVLAQPREAVLAEMRAVVGDRSLPIYAMARYALGWIEADGGPRSEPAGKGIRPALAVLAGRAIDPSDAAGRRALAGAAAVEFVHNFSLVHDDIQDRDDERHHRPTVWRVWGEAQAINVGDSLRELAQSALSRATQAGASADTVLAAADTLNRCTMEMIEGQYLDLDFESRGAVSADDYLTMVERKTGALLGCSLALGARLAGADRDVAARLEHAGRCLGWPSRSATTCWASGATAAPPASRRTTTSGGARSRSPSSTLSSRRTRRSTRRWRASTRWTRPATARRSATRTCAASRGRSTRWGAGGVGASGRPALRRLPRRARRLRPARGGPGGAGGGGAVHRAAGALRGPR